MTADVPEIVLRLAKKVAIDKLNRSPLKNVEVSKK